MSIRLENGAANALTTEVLLELRAAIAQARKLQQGVLLCGGTKFFSNGVDLEWALTRNSQQMRELFLQLGNAILDLLECKQPVVAAIQGHAIGGALALFLTADYRYSANGRVLLRKPEVLIGVPNPFFADQLLRFVANDYVASDLIYSGRLVTGEDARALHLVHEVADKESIEALALDKLVELKQLTHDAFSESKDMRNQNICARIRAQMFARVARQVEIWNTPEAQAKLRLAAQRLSR